MRAFTSKLEVAATTKNAPSRSANSKLRCFQKIALDSTCRVRAAVSSGATAVTRAPERNRPAILASAMGPPPTTRQGFPSSFRNIGKSDGCSALILRLHEECGPLQGRARHRRNLRRQDRRESPRRSEERRVGKE